MNESSAHMLIERLFGYYQQGVLAQTLCLYGEGLLPSKAAWSLIEKILQTPRDTLQEFGHPDFMYLGRQRERERLSKEISVEDVRPILPFSRTTPAYSCKLIFLENMNQFTSQACQALLKTLEEPRKNIYFILTTSSFYSLLPTIRSRCQKYHMQPSFDGASFVARKIGGAIDSERYKDLESDLYKLLMYSFKLPEHYDKIFLLGQKWLQGMKDKKNAPSLEDSIAPIFLDLFLLMYQQLLTNQNLVRSSEGLEEEKTLHSSLQRLSSEARLSIEKNLNQLFSDQKIYNLDPHLTLLQGCMNIYQHNTV